MQETQFRVWYLFLAQVIAIAGILNWFGKFEATPQFDTSSYRDYSFESVSDALNDKRTFVYPSVLRFFLVADGSERLVPWFQYSLSAVAVGVFLASLLRCEWNPWLAFAAASPILASQMVLEYTGVLTPDLLAQSFAVVTVALWLIAVHSGRSLVALAGMSVFLFLAYQTKPSYLFLLAFIPIGGLIARWWLHPTDKDAWKLAIRLSFASFVPFLAWCSLRWFVVGHFGLVSFGGYNIIGVAGQLLQRDWTASLTSEVQPLATEILNRREQLKDWPIEPNYENYEANFNKMVWEIAVPIASEKHQADSRVMNRQMADLSMQILMGHPKSYAIWLMLAAKRSMRQVIELTLRNPIVMLSFPILLAAFAFGWRLKGDESKQTSELKSDREFQTIVWTAIGFATCKLALVVLVEPPIDRYCAPAGVFLTSILAMVACQFCLRLNSDKSQFQSIV